MKTPLTMWFNALEKNDYTKYKKAIKIKKGKIKVSFLNYIYDTNFMIGKHFFRAHR